MLFYLVLLAPVILLAISLLTPKKKDAPKEVSGLLGVLGLIIKKWENPVEALQAAYNKFGSIFTITFLGPFGPRITILTEPSATSTFFKAPDEVMNQPEVYSFTKYVFGTRVLYDLTPVEATHNIKNLSGALSAARMRTYADLMVKEAREFFNAWGESGTVDLKEEMAKLIINTASRCLLGKEIRELLHEKVASLYHDLDAGLTPISFFAPWLPTGPHRRRDCARQEMQELFRPFIVARREGKTVGEDFLQTLIDSRDKHGVAYDDQQITGMLLLAIFAGQHTSSVTATWTGVMMMLEKPGLMLEVQHEQQRVFAKHNGVFNWDSLGELTLLGQCIKEALRMHPPLMAIMRKAMKDVKIGDTVIPKGDIVVVSPPVCNLSDKVFVDPNTFDPHRFDPDLEELYEQFSYTSFGGGRHGCMGENFAYLQVKCIWSFLLQEFDFSLVEQKKPQQDYDALVVVPKGEVLIKYKRKTTNLLKEKLAPLPTRDMSKRRFPAHVKDKKIISDKPVKKFTRAEVAKHCTREDCWLIVKGKVYDVTSYVVIHKGGDSILKNAGKDNTVGFFGEQHPKAAAEVLEDFYIGDLSD